MVYRKLVNNEYYEYYVILSEWTEPNGLSYIRIQNINTKECFNINKDLMQLLEPLN